MAQIKYTVVLRNPVSGAIFEVLPTSYSFREKLNTEPTASFKFSFEYLKTIITDVYGASVLDTLSNQLMEMYIDRDGTKIYYGVLSELSIAPGSNGEKNIDVKSHGFFGLFNKRIVGVPKTVYTATDAGDIAWDLIDDSQNSDSPYSEYGITQGATPATVTRDRTYRFDNVRESIIRLSNENLENGFDFDIDVLKQFNVYYPTKGVDRPNVVFDERTISGFTWKKPLFQKLANKVHVTGQGFNDDVLYTTRTAGTSFRTPFGTLEEVLQERDVIELATLESKGDRRLSDAKEPIIDFTVEHYDIADLISFDQYDIGDTVRANIEDLAMSLETKRVVEREFSVDENSTGKIKSTLR